MTGYAGQCTRVYALHGKMAHLLAPWESPNLGYAFTLCRRQPRLFTAWLGTGSQAEYERAASLPACEQCLRAAAKTEAGQARPGGTSTQDFPAGPPPSGGELNAAAAVTAAGAPGNPMYARENVTTGDPRADCGTAAASATPRAGTAAPEPVSGAGHPPAPLTAESAPDGTGSVPGADCGTLEPPTRARSRKAPAAGMSPGGRGNPSQLGREGEQDGQGAERLGALPPAQEPPGDARSSAASPGAGQQFRNAWKAARSAQAKAGRTARGKWPAKRQAPAYGPGMTRRLPPEAKP